MLIEAVKVLEESANSGFEIVVEVVKKHEEALKMATTAETVQ